MDWKTYSFVIRGSTRKKVLLSLHAPKTPSQIARETKTSTAHISRALRELEKKGLVECLTPREKRGRIYRLTSQGSDIQANVKRSEVA